MGMQANLVGRTDQEKPWRVAGRSVVEYSLQWAGGKYCSLPCANSVLGTGIQEYFV